MHPSVPDECKPILLSGTKRIPFPGPLKKVKMPKKLKASDRSGDEDNAVENDSPGGDIVFFFPGGVVMSFPKI